ncbi:MAG: endonuclease/exonuclease/phosphatase family protein [Pseudonocardiaceae bacterium]
MSPSRLRLATFNILHGLSLHDGKVLPERLAEACTALDADVLCLQEVDRFQARSYGADQSRAVAERMGARWWRFEPAIIGEPGAVWRAAVDADSDQFAAPTPGYGVALFSRLEVSSWRVVRLPAAPVRAPVYVPGAKGRFIVLADEPRVGLVAMIKGPSGLLAVACTHLSFVPAWNARQLRQLIASMAGSAIVAGDLNLPGSPVRLVARAAGWRSLARGATFPAGQPRLQIDHVLARGRVGSVGSVSTPLMTLSDHRALVVDLMFDD